VALTVGDLNSRVPGPLGAGLAEGVSAPEPVPLLNAAARPKAAKSPKQGPQTVTATSTVSVRDRSPPENLLLNLLSMISSSG
jgi:hypothetical protein